MRRRRSLAPSYVIPAKAGIPLFLLSSRPKRSGIPAFAGMTVLDGDGI
jgi:hypothetical protein